MGGRRFVVLLVVGVALYAVGRRRRRQRVGRRHPREARRQRATGRRRHRGPRARCGCRAAALVCHRAASGAGPAVRRRPARARDRARGGAARRADDHRRCHSTCRARSRHGRTSSPPTRTPPARSAWREQVVGLTGLIGGAVLVAVTTRIAQQARALPTWAVWVSYAVAVLCLSGFWSGGMASVAFALWLIGAVIGVLRAARRTPPGLPSRRRTHRLPMRPARPRPPQRLTPQPMGRLGGPTDAADHPGTAGTRRRRTAGSPHPHRVRRVAHCTARPARRDDRGGHHGPFLPVRLHPGRPPIAGRPVRRPRTGARG